MFYKFDTKLLFPASQSDLNLFEEAECFPLTAWNVSKYGVFSGLYFPVFSPNTGKYGPKKLRIWTLFTQFLDTSQAPGIAIWREILP